MLKKVAVVVFAAMVIGMFVVDALSSNNKPKTIKPVTTKPVATRPTVGVWWPAYLDGRWWKWNDHLTYLKRIGVTDLYIDDGNLGYSRHSSRLVSTDWGNYIDKVMSAKNPGIRIHIWRQNLYVDKGSQSYNDLVNHGAVLGDTNFIDPANDYAMELDKKVTMEVLNKYAGKIAGYNFDYIRYPNASIGYTEAARTKFEAKYGKVNNWPADVLSGPLASTFAQFKRDLITQHVKDMSTTIKSKYPKIIISVDVWPDYAYCKNGLMQDWPTWKRYVKNFIHMTYIEPEGNAWFRKMTQANARLARPNAALTGIGNIGEPGAIFNPTSNMLLQAKFALKNGAKGITIWHDDKRVRNEFLMQLKTYLDATYNTKPAPARTKTP